MTNQTKPNKMILLGDLVNKKKILLTRGNVISKNTMRHYPGSYPVYSSSIENNGLFGMYGKFMFDNELITWSVDGGGNFFYRPKHKYSVTNVSGILRILSDDIDYKYLYYYLSEEHKKLKFDYVLKAHPSVIKKLYSIRLPNVKEQIKIAEILSVLDDSIENLDKLTNKYEHIRQGLMQDLFSSGIDEQGKIRRTETDKFKDSELGQIPLEWGVKKLSDLYQIPSRNGLYKQASYYGSGNRMIHMPQMFKGVTIDASEADRVSINKQELKRYSLEKGDILFARRSLNFEGAGLCAIVSDHNEPITFESSIIRVRLNMDLVDPYFVVYFLRSSKGYLLRRPFIRQVAVSGVSSEDIAQFTIPYPSFPEQKRIVKTLDLQNLVIRLLEKERNKYARMKIGLMNDLLSGKVSIDRVKT